MTHTLSIERTADDLVDATLIALTDSGILSRIGERITHTTETPDRYVYAADLAIVIDIPKRGELDGINRFAADATQRASAHSATRPSDA